MKLQIGIICEASFNKCVLFSFSLTLVDSLDTLVVMGDIEEFDRALRLVVRDVSFDNDVVVSVFETNIRMVGGLLSGHVLAEHLNQVKVVDFVNVILLMTFVIPFVHP